MPISNAFLLYALLCLPGQTAARIASVQRCQDLAGPLDSVFSGGESGMAVMLKGRGFATVELFLPDGSQRKDFVLSSGY